MARVPDFDEIPAPKFSKSQSQSKSLKWGALYLLLKPGPSGVIFRGYFGWLRPYRTCAIFIPLTPIFTVTPFCKHKKEPTHFVSAHTGWEHRTMPQSLRQEQGDTGQEGRKKAVGCMHLLSSSKTYHAFQIFYLMSMRYLH